MTAKADDTFKVGDILYSEVDSSTCKVCYESNYLNIGPEVNIPASVKHDNKTYRVIYVDYEAFRGCSNISKITLSNGIEEILSQAFMQTSITEIEIPASVIAIGENIFWGCNSLKKICFKGMNPPTVNEKWLGDVNNIIIEIPEGADKSAWEIALHISGNNNSITLKAGNSNSYTSFSPNQENNSNGEVEFIEEEPIKRIPTHVCQYEWEVVREVSADQYGLEQYLCKLCGNVQSTLTIPASQYQVQELYTKVTGAAEGETVTYDTGMVHTVCDKFFTKLQQRKDITLVITYQYKGESYRTTFPAGADYTELLQDADQFYGMLGLNGRCGIVTEKN